MNLGLEDFDSLSKTSDHVGNLANVLSVLGGPTTILHELTQNADDAATASRVAFTITSTELIAWNDGEFSTCGDQKRAVCPWKLDAGRSCDLHSFRTFAGRHKSHDVDTTGAFGVGFTSVYQITDHPELITGGYHLILDENADEQHRIRVCKGHCGRDHQVSGTTFYLPWATDQTDLRMDLGAQVVTSQDIDLLEAAFLEHAADALLFLKRVTAIDVRTRSDSTVVTRTRAADRVVITDGTTTTTWLFVEGGFDSSQDLKAKFPSIDRNRSGDVTVALPVGEMVEGRVYGGLPTQTKLGWSGHVNASFYPREDRKGVLLDDGTYRSEWNRDLIDSAAALIQKNLGDVSEAIGLEATWELVRDFELANRPGPGHEEAFEPFFERIKGAISDLPIMRTIRGDVRPPRGCLVPQSTDEYQANSILTDLDLPIIDASLRSTVMSLTYTAYGMEQLKASHLVDALVEHEIVEPWHPSTGRYTDDEMEQLLATLELLLSRSSTAVLDKAHVPAIVPCVDGRFAPAQVTITVRESDQSLFVEVGQDLIVDVDRLEQLCPTLMEHCPELDVATALDVFENADEERLGPTAQRILSWFDDRRIDLQFGTNRSRAAALAIYPSSVGGLKPLDALSLPSDFEDELGLADLVDVGRVHGHGDLLRALGARELNAVDYLVNMVVPLADGETFSDHETSDQIIRIVHQARPRLEVDKGAYQSVRGAQLVLCTDGEVRAAKSVHLPNAAVQLIDPSAPIADVIHLPDHLVETLVWLGVGATPNRDLLNTATLRLSADENEPDTEVVVSILNAVRGLSETHGSVPVDLSNLQELAWLPVEGGGRARPHEIFPTFRRHLFESQGPKLGLSREAQQRYSETLRWLGMPSDPPTSLVVAHLQHCVETGTPLHSDVYQTLGTTSDERLVRELANERCVQVAPGEFVHPDSVFWTETGLGTWATRLPSEQRRYQDFYDRVGVAEAPTAGHLERLLKRVAKEFTTSALDDETQTIVHQAWSLLQDLLKDDDAVRNALASMGRIPSVVDSRGLLNSPDLLIFRDGRGQAEKIELLSQNVIRRERNTWRALEAAGVRRAEDLIEVTLDEGGRVPAPDVAALVSDRRRPIVRVVESEFDDDDEHIDPEPLFRIKFLRTDHLTVKYRAVFGNTVQTTDPVAIQSFYSDADHTLIFSEPADTLKIAQELARYLAGEDHPGLALQLDKVLSAGSVDDAQVTLDALGVADLADVERAILDSGTVADFDFEDHRTEEREPSEEPDADRGANVVADEGDAPQAIQDDHTQAPENHAESLPAEPQPGVSAPGAANATARHAAGNPPATGTPQSGDGRSTPPRPSGERTRGTRRERMHSYVHFANDQDSETVGDEALRNSSIDTAGIARVLEHEASCGRTPEEQDHWNPGFDVLSRDASGQILRRIEVKSVSGDWSLRGVLMSRRQYLEAREHPEEFWLYVVENAEDDHAFEIHRLKNPASAITHYGFDDGWKALREPDTEQAQA